MADAVAGGDVGKAIGDPLGTFAGWLAGFVPEGPARTPVLVVYGLCAAVAPFIYKYYLGVLAQGAAPEGSQERQDYDRLRASLAGGNLAARLYAKWLTAFLDGIVVLGVQAFDELAVRGGGEKAAVLPLPALFDGIAKNPAAPEYWWVYALLLSSMIPSIINLAIGGMAFTRGIPWLARLLLQWIPEGKAVPEYKRQPAAIGLIVQMFAGAGLGIAAQAFLAWGLIFHAMPWIGLDLLDMARAVAAFDLPTRISQLFVSVQ
jgi:hypothetical protein